MELTSSITSGLRISFDIGRLGTHPLRSWWMDVDVVGAENLPESDGGIIAANHLSFIDSMLLMYGIGRPVTFLGKVEYMDSMVTRHVFPAVGMIPVDRSGSGIRRSLQEARNRIEEGELVGIFPEGTRSRDGLLHDGHNGVAHLSLKTGAPIIPVGLVGTDKAMPVGDRVPGRAPVQVNIGTPIVPDPDRGRSASVRMREALTSQVMDSIADLSGQVRAQNVRTLQDA